MEDFKEKRAKIKSPWIKAMLAGFGALALAILLYLLLSNTDTVGDGINDILALFRPFIIGGVIAYVLAPLCNNVEKWLGQVFPEKIKKAAPTIAVAVSMIFFILIIYLLLIMIIPQLYTSIISLSETLPGQMQSLINKIAEHLKGNETLYGYVMTAIENIQKGFTNWVNNTLLPDMSSIISGLGTGVKSVLSVLLDIVVGAIVAVTALWEGKTSPARRRWSFTASPGRNGATPSGARLPMPIRCSTAS